MSWAGVGNAAAGTAAVNIAHLFTRDENKPATKKDIKEIKQLFITQHHHIKKCRIDMMVLAFYDLQTKNLVYLIKPMSHGPKNIDDIKNSIDNSVLTNKDIAKIS
jgi:endonuclease III-like uncharacterized protein